MKSKFQLTAVAVALMAVSGGAFADVNVDGTSYIAVNNTASVSIDGLPVGSSASTSLNSTGFNVNVQNSTVLAGGAAVAGQDLVIPTVNPAFANTTQTFNQDRVDTEVGQVRNIGSQVYDQNKVQFAASEQTGDQSWTTPQSATAQYDANGVIVPGSLSGPTLGVTTDNGFVPSSVNKVQDLTLGRNNATEDYSLSISKTENSTTNSTQVTAAGITTTGTIKANGFDANGNKVINVANGTLDTDAANVGQVNAGDAATLAAANTYANAGDAATLAAANTYADAGDAATLAAANTHADAGDAAIRNDIATKVTTAELEVNGPSQFNGFVTVNASAVNETNLAPTTTASNFEVPGAGNPDEVKVIDYTQTATTSQQRDEKTQLLDADKFVLKTATKTGNEVITTQMQATATYNGQGLKPVVVTTEKLDQDGNPIQAIDFQATGVVSEDTIIVGKETADSVNGFTVRNTNANGTTQTAVTAGGLTTSGSVTAKTVTADNITLAGKDLASTISEGDAATLTSAKAHTDTTASAIRTELATGDAATLTSAKAHTDTTASAIRTELATGDAATLTSAKAHTNTTASAIRTELTTGDAATLATSKTYTDVSSKATLAAANAYSDAGYKKLGHRLDNIEQTAYRGVAISLAAQQAVPNMKPGNFALYGGLGHYEGESAGALGVATLLDDGRTSISAAIGFAESEVGGRVGVSYVFGN